MAAIGQDIEIAKQLRLRDIGGIIIIDYIDMEKKEQLDKQAKEVKTVTSTVAATPVADSTKNAAAQAQLGSFGYSATLPSATDAVTEIKNEVLSLKISNKGGYIVDAR